MMTVVSDHTSRCAQPAVLGASGTPDIRPYCASQASRSRHCRRHLPSLPRPLRSRGRLLAPLSSPAAEFIIMQLRNGTVLGSGQMPPQHRPAFEEGVRVVFSKWTALCLAVENEWGGQYSRDKAQQLMDDCIAWFYRNKEHYADDLEVELDESLMNDFNVEAEDGSPTEVARALVQLHKECCVGDWSMLERLRASAAGGAAGSVQQRDGADANEVSSSSGDERGDNMEEDAPYAAAVAAASGQPHPKPAPVVDDDGFELVQPRRGRNRR